MNKGCTHWGCATYQPCLRHLKDESQRKTNTLSRRLQIGKWSSRARSLGGSVGVGVMEGKEGPRGSRATGDGWLAVEGKRGRADIEGTGRIGDTGERRN